MTYQIPLPELIKILIQHERNRPKYRLHKTIPKYVVEIDVMDEAARRLTALQTLIDANK